MLSEGSDILRSEKSEREIFRNAHSHDFKLLKEGSDEEREKAAENLEMAEGFSFDFLTLEESRLLRKLQETKREAELPELKKLLATKTAKDFREEHWNFITHFSLDFLIKKTDTNTCSSFLLHCQKAPKRYQKYAWNWLRAELWPENLGNLRKKEKALGKKAEEILVAITGEKTLDRYQNSEQQKNDALQVGSEVFDAINASAPEEFQDEAIANRHSRETNQMLAAIRHLGDAQLNAQAEAFRAEERAQINAFDHKSLNALRQKRVDLFARIQETIERRIAEAVARGAENLRAEIPLLREQLAPFSEIVADAFSKDYAHQNGNGAPAKKAFLRNVEILLRRAEHYAEIVEHHKTSKEILDALKPADFDAEHSDDTDYIQGKKFIELFLAHCKTVSAEAVQKSVLFQEIRSDFFARENPEEIAKKTGFSVVEVQQYFESNELPRSFQIPIFREWADTRGISSEKISSLLNLAPAESVFFAEDSDFVAASLFQNPETAGWFSSTNNNFVREFLRGGLLKIATNSLQSANDLVFGNYTRVEDGKSISEEVRQEVFAKADAKVAELRHSNFPERADALAEKLNTLCTQHPNNLDMRNAKNALEKIGNLRQLQGYSEFSDFLAPYFYDAATGISEAKIPSAEDLESLFSKLEQQVSLWENATDSPSVEKVIDLEAEGRKKAFSEFSEWVQNGTGNFSEILENLKNAKMLEILDDESYAQKTRADVKSNPAMVEFGGDFPRIFVAKSCLENNSELAKAALRHEAAHIWDESSGNQFSHEFWELLQKNIPDEKKANFQDFLKNHFPGEEQIEETFAHAFASWDQGFLKKLEEFTSPEGFQEIQDFLKRDFFHESEKKGVQGTETQGKKRFFSVGEIPPAYAERNPEYQRQFAAQLDRFEKNINALRKIRNPQTLQKADQGEQEFQSWIEKFSNPPEDSSKPIDKDSEEIIGLVSGFSKNAESLMGTIAEDLNPELGYFADLWDNTTFLSMADFGTMWTTITETLKRRHERASKLRTGKAGKAIFGNTLLGNEFDNRKEAAENEEVGKYKEGLTNKDGWQIMERLEKTKNKDELKACLILLSENGRIDWYDRRIWRALERVGGGLTILDSDAENLNALKTKLQKMCANLWDNDFFRQTDNANGSGYESGKGKYKNELEANENNIEPTLQAMLRQKRAGGNVDPQRYEAYIDSCVGTGKSCPENIFWFILQGVNFGILNIDRIYYFDSTHLNTYPPIQWFANKKPKLNEIRQIAQMFPPGDGMSIPDDFNEWFLTVVMGSEGVLSRTIKIAPAAGEKLDHDWATTLLCIGDAGLAKIVMGKERGGGGPRMPSTAYPNMTVGQLAYITSLARNRQNYSQEDLAREIKRHASFAMTTHLLLSRSIKSDNYHGLSDYELGTPPRSSAGKALYMGHANPGTPDQRELKTQEIIDSQYQILRTLYPDGFFFLDKGYDIDDNLEDTVRDINRYFPGVLPQNFSPRNSTDILEYIEPMVEFACDNIPGAMDALLQEAQKVYSEHHTGEPKSNANSFVPGGGSDWKNLAWATTGYNPDESRGMYQ